MKSIQFGCMLLLLILFISPCLLFSQLDLPINQWATHLPYNNAEKVEVGDKFVFYATNKAILKLSRDDFSFQKLSKTEGLSDSEIAALYFHKPMASLIICYRSGLIDIIKPTGKLANADILNFNNIPIDKTIHSISFYDNKSALINAAYGISLLNLETGRILFTLFTPTIPIVASARINRQIFILSANAVYRFDERSKGIIQDFGSWTKLAASDGLPERSAYNGIALYKNKLYVSTANAVYQFDSAKFHTWYSSPDWVFEYLKAQELHLFASVRHKQNTTKSIMAFSDQPNPVFLSKECVENNTDIAQSEDGKIWLADNRWGFRSLKEISSSSCDVLFVSGPLQSEVFEIGIFSDGTYFAGGGIKLNYLPLYNSAGVMKFANNRWTAINAYDPALSQFSPFQDALRIREHPDKSKIYIGLYGQGLLEYDKATNNHTMFNASNSLLTGVMGDSTIVRVVGLDFDKNQTLWVATYAGIYSIFSFDKNRVWKRHPFHNFLFNDLKVDHNGYVWASIRDGGVLVYDPAKNQQILLNKSNSELTTNDVRCIEVDLDGDVWVGTAEGPVVFECDADIFSGRCRGNRRKVNQDGIIYYLLSSEIIRSIAVDGANRKWFGTSNNGVYVQSPSGENQIYFFNSKNSPLLDDNILDIAIDPKNGYAWIATAKGLQVFRCDATGATNFFSTTHSVFPNPVPPDFNGLIAINGLARDAKVKITDMSGRLVYETIANGGQATWDGYDYLGRKASSGVYLVFANATQDFEQTQGFVTKIVIAK